MDLLLPPGHELPDWAGATEYGRPAVIYDLPAERYHGARALISKSALDVFERSPEHYAHYLDTGIDDDVEERIALAAKEPEALTIGSAFHCLVLEPEVFARTYKRLPDFGSMQSPANRALRDAWRLENAREGFTGLKADHWQMIHGMRESVLRHRRIRRVLENGRPEVTITAIDPHTGLPRKVRLDWMSELEGIGLDLKSARDGRWDRWKLEAARRRYDVQDAYYSDTAELAGLDLPVMGFGVVEKTPPYVCGLYTLGAKSRLAGELKYRRALDGLAHCCETGEFPGYGEGNAMEIDLPSYATAETAGVT